jgi:glucose dehydrogenase
MRSWIRSIADNVKQLRVAWTFRTGELATYEGTKASEKAAFEATPIVIRDTLYFSTPTTRVFALDANTGKQRCTYNPEVDLTKHYSEITSRGVSYWKNPEANDPAQDRVFVPTLDARLIALNAHTGKLVREFGKDGEVDMKDGVGNVREVPLGTLGNPDKYPDSDDWGSISLGGAITTASGLVFIASTLDGHPVRQTAVAFQAPRWWASNTHELPSRHKPSEQTVRGDCGRRSWKTGDSLGRLRRLLLSSVTNKKTG